MLEATTHPDTQTPTVPSAGQDARASEVADEPLFAPGEIDEALNDIFAALSGSP